MGKSKLLSSITAKNSLQEEAEEKLCCSSVSSNDALPSMAGRGRRSVGKAQICLPGYLTSEWWNLALETDQRQKSTSKAEEEFLGWLQKGLQGI